MTNEQRAQFKESLGVARETRDELVLERTKIDRELMQQSKVIAALSELLGESIDSDIGITEATLLVIRAANGPATPIQIRDELRKIGYDIDSFSNPMASLHQVLKRLEDKGEIREVKNSEGKKYYQFGGWRSLMVGSPPPVLEEGMSLMQKRKK